MRELHVVAVSEDGRHVVLAASKGAKSGTHRVRLDARLSAAVRGDLRAADAPEVDLSPKEIQARLRAGESAEQIARAAGVPVTRVERFGGPVAGEMARTLDTARQAYVVRGRRGRSTTPLGTAVDAALTATARPDSVRWSTRRAEDSRWRVAVEWFARGRQREAAWWFDPATKELAPLDPASATLGHVDADQHRRPAARPAPKPEVAARAKKPAAKKPAAKPTTAKATPRKSAAKATPRKSAAKATPKPTTAKATPKKSAAKATPRKSAAARPRLQVVPDPPRAAPREAQKGGVASRASVPAWADVLLGTTPGGDR